MRWIDGCRWMYGCFWMDVCVGVDVDVRIQKWMADVWMDEWMDGYVDEDGRYGQMDVEDAWMCGWMNADGHMQMDQYGWICECGGLILIDGCKQKDVEESTMSNSEVRQEVCQIRG